MSICLHMSIMTNRATNLLLIFGAAPFISVQCIVSEQLESREINCLHSHADAGDDQDIYRAFNISWNYWLYGFNFHSNHTVGKHCVYLTVDHLTESAMNYSSNFVKNCTRGKIDYLGTFYNSSTESENAPTRVHYNSLRAVVKGGGWIVMNYTLLYSNYDNCSLFRVPNINDGDGCMVLLTNSTVQQGMTWQCRDSYNTYCNKTGFFEKIFENNCTEDFHAFLY